MTDTDEFADNARLKIETVDEAINLIAQLETESFEFSERDYEELELVGEITTLFIGIDGPSFHGTITGGLARGLWHYQKEIYKAAAFAIYNNDNYGRIPKSDLKTYTLVFEVKEGSTELIAKILEIGKDLVEKTMEGMTPKAKAALLLKIILGLGGLGAVSYISTNLSADYFTHATTTRTEELKTRQEEISYEKEKLRIEAEVERDRIQAETTQAIINSDPISRRFNEAAGEGTKAIAKYNPDATKLQVGSQSLGREQIEELNQRSAREVPDMFNIVGYYRVTSTTEPSADGFVRVGLSGNGDEFIALLNLQDEEKAYTDEQINSVFLAPKNSERVYMNVRVKRASDGIREAYIEGFPTPPQKQEH